MGAQVLTPEAVLQKSGLTGPSGDDISKVLYTLADPEKVRQMIIQSGEISAAELSRIDDKTLMSMVNELLAGQLGGVSSTAVLDSAGALEEKIK